MNESKRKKEKRINPETGQNEVRYENDDLWMVKKEDKS